MDEITADEIAADEILVVSHSCEVRDTFQGPGVNISRHDYGTHVEYYVNGSYYTEEGAWALLCTLQAALGAV
jgi:hypothetical protein